MSRRKNPRCEACGKRVRNMQPYTIAVSRGRSLDVAHGEKIEKELDNLITRRHDQRVKDEGHRPSEEMYEESTRRYQEQMRVRARYEWHLHHTAQAERLRRTLEELVSYHETQAERLLTEG